MDEQRDSAFGIKLDLTYKQALDRVIEALKEEGFGVLTSVDVRATLKEKLGAEFRPYTILGACNPPLALRALTEELDAGLVLPCNVVVYEEGSQTVANFADPLVIADLLGNSALSPIAEEAAARLRRVLDSLVK